MRDEWQGNDDEAMYMLGSDFVGKVVRRGEQFEATYKTKSGWQSSDTAYESLASAKTAVEGFVSGSDVSQDQP